MNPTPRGASKPVMRKAIRSLLGIPAVAALLAVAPSAPAGGLPRDQTCIERAVHAIQSRYQTIGDLRARFAQTTSSVALGGGTGGRIQKSAGTVQFSKPGKMRWSYQEPEPSLVVSDGETLWIYDPARGEVQRLTVSEGYFSGAAIQFLLGEGDILRDFHVTLESCGASSIVLTLVPREPASYEKLRVRTDPDTGDVVETQVVDLLGNVTEVRFEDIGTDLGPPAHLFSFEVPAGVQVIELDAVSPGEGRRE